MYTRRRVFAQGVKTRHVLRARAYYYFPGRWWYLTAAAAVGVAAAAAAVVQCTTLVRGLSVCFGETVSGAGGARCLLYK